MAFWRRLAGPDVVTLRELIDMYRALSRDTATPPNVDDAQATLFANEGVSEACRRGDMIIDSTVSVSVTANDPLVKLPTTCLEIRRARMDGGTSPLLPVFTCELDASSAQWEDEVGTVTNYIPDYQTGYILLYQQPEIDGTLRMSVRRLPKHQMSADGDEPEIRAEHHMGIVQWMLYRAFGITDADMFDSQRSAAALAEFEREFGTRSSARNEAWQRSAQDALSASPVA